MIILLTIKAISKLPEGQNIEIREEEIEIENYANFISVLYNQNWLGFQLDSKFEIILLTIFKIFLKHFIRILGNGVSF